MLWGQRVFSLTPGLPVMTENLPPDRAASYAKKCSVVLFAGQMATRASNSRCPAQVFCMSRCNLTLSSGLSADSII